MANTGLPPPPPGFTMEGQPPQGGATPPPPPGFTVEGQNAPQPDAPQHQQARPTGATGADAAFTQLAPPRQLAAEPHDISALSYSASQRHGIPFGVFNTMLGLESSGSHDAHLTSSAGAVGPAQVMPDTFKSYSHGSIYNFNDNIDVGAAVYSDLLRQYKDPVLAAGAYNAGSGAIDKWLAGKGQLSQETKVYMATVAAQVTGTTESPLPPEKKKVPSLVVPAPPTQRGHANRDTMKAHHSFIEEAGGQADLPYIWANAQAADQMLGTGHQQMDKAMAAYKSDPAGASQYYGVNSPYMLDLFAKHGNTEQKAEATFLQQHPMASATETLIEEWFNPMAVAEGFGAEGALHGAWSAAQTTEAGRALTHFASPFREIVAKFGPNARNMLHTMAQRVRGVSKPAMNNTKEVFEGLTREEKIDVVRRHHEDIGAKPLLKNRPDLDERAAKLTQQERAMTEAQVRARVLKGSIDDETGVASGKQIRKGYFPMHGSNYEHPYYDAEQTGAIEQLRMGPGVKPYQKVEGAKTYANIDEALASEPGLKESFDPAENWYRYQRARQGNIEFENGLRRMAEKYPNMIRLGARTSRSAPKGMVKADDLLGHVDSPTLKNAWISPDFGRWLGERGGSTISGQARWTLDPTRHRIAQAFDKYNSVMRAMIMNTPWYHPFWNIARNASPVERASLPGSVMNYVRAAVNQALAVPEFLKVLGLPEQARTLGAMRDGLFGKAITGMQQYGADVLDAAKAASSNIGVAPNSLLGGTAAHIRTAPFSELSPLGKVDKFITNLGDWNREQTFDRFGEEAFSNRLFAKFTDPKGPWKMDTDDAGWAVREALGNYLNVSPDSWQSKFLFFYPWLKTNVAFWMKNFITQPRYVTAPAMAFQNQRQVAGDPSAYDPKYSRGEEQVYLGRDKQGQDVRYTPMDPARDTEKILDALDPRLPSMGGPDLETRFENVAQIGQGRLQPVEGFVVNMLGTIYGRREPAGTYQGFETIYDKDAKRADQVKQGMLMAGGSLVPAPSPYLVHAVAADIAQNGVSGFAKNVTQGQRIAGYVTELFGAGVVSYTQATNIKSALGKANNGLERRLRGLDRRQQKSSSPLSAEDYEARRDRIIDAYNKQVQHINERTATMLHTSPQNMDSKMAQPPPPPGFTEEQPSADSGSPPPPPPGYTLQQ